MQSQMGITCDLPACVHLHLAVRLRYTKQAAAQPSLTALAGQNSDASSEFSPIPSHQHSQQYRGFFLCSPSDLDKVSSYAKRARGTVKRDYQRLLPTNRRSPQTGQWSLPLHNTAQNRVPLLTAAVQHQLHDRNSKTCHNTRLFMSTLRR